MAEAGAIDTSALQAAAIEHIYAEQDDSPIVNWDGQEDEAITPNVHSHWVLEEDAEGRVTTIKCEKHDDGEDTGEDFREILKGMKQEESDAKADDAREATSLLDQVEEERRFGGGVSQ